MEEQNIPKEVVTEQTRGTLVKEIKPDVNPVGLNINLKIPDNGNVIVPLKEPVTGRPLAYFTEDNVQLIPMKLQVQPTLEGPPLTNDQLFKQAASGDDVTIKSWEEIWLKEFNLNKAKWDLNALSVLQLAGKEAYKPVILAGSGPSLKKNFLKLKDHVVRRNNPKTFIIEDALDGGRKGIPIVSALHNFGLFELHDIMTENDYYVTLDAGQVTLPEMTEGGQGQRPEEWFWERTKDRTLITTIYGNHELLSKWRGKIYFFHQSWNSDKIKKEIFDSGAVDIKKMPPFATGGNVLGACLYFARAVLGSGPTIFIGADFSFSYDHKFHSWNSRYDAQFQGLIPCTDIFGNRVFTWPSYYNFKCWFDCQACGGQGQQPQMFINATEGGIFGAYPTGNIRQVIQLSLDDALKMFTVHTHLKYFTENTDKMPIVLF